MSTNRAFEGDNIDEANISLANSASRRNAPLSTISRSSTSDEVPIIPNNEHTQLNPNDDFSTYFSDAKIQIPEHELVRSIHTI